MTINWSNVTTINDYLVIPNTNTGGWFWTSLVYMVVLLEIITLSIGFGIESALLVGAFSLIIFGLITSTLGLTNFMLTAVVGAGYIFIVIVYNVWNRR